MFVISTQDISPDISMVIDLLPQHFPPDSDLVAGVREIDQNHYCCEIYSLDVEDVFRLTLPFSDRDRCTDYADAINRVLGVEPQWVNIVTSFCQRVAPPLDNIPY